MRWTICRAAILLLVVAAGPALRAEPAFAVRTGYRCSQCHVNRTGGGLRTPFGSLYTQTTLPARLLRWRDEANLLPANPDARFAIGGDVRSQYLVVRSDDQEDISSFEGPDANLYGEVRLLPGRMTLYADETIAPGGASSRELFALFAFGGPRRGYVKAGKFLPSFGWRLPDDDAFIRQFSGFTYSAPDTGVEVGIEPGKWSVFASVLNGSTGSSDDNRSKKLVAQAVRRFRTFRVGLSGSRDDDNDDVTTTHAGLFGGFNLGRLAVLGELDRVETSRGPEEEARLLGLLELDLLVSRGWNVKYARDWIDPDTDVDTDQRSRDSLGVEYIPYPFVQLRLFVRRKDGPPQIPGSRDEQLDLELHVFF